MIIHFSLLEQALHTLGEWLNNVAFQAPDAPVVIVGTHKDELEHPEEELAQAQALVHDYMKGTFVAGEEGILNNIRRPAKKDGTLQWFFGVDSKSRESIPQKGLQSSDPGIAELREAIHQAILEDTRTVTGLFLRQKRFPPCMNVTVCQTLC